MLPGSRCTRSFGCWFGMRACLHSMRCAPRRETRRFLRRANEVGTITVGRQADLLLLDANPLDDIGHVSRISVVVLRGRWLDRTALDRVVPEASAAPDVLANDWVRRPTR